MTEAKGNTITQLDGLPALEVVCSHPLDIHLRGLHGVRELGLYFCFLPSVK